MPKGDLNPYQIWREANLPGSHQRTMYHAAYPTEERRDQALELLRKQQPDVVWLRRDPLDRERPDWDPRRTL